MKLSCGNCLTGCSQALCPFALSQGIVSGGYTYVDPTGAVVNVQYPTGQAPASEEAQSFLESTSPLFGLQWQWVLLAGLGLWLVMRKK
jgi:hypothetical protein